MRNHYLRDPDERIKEPRECMECGVVYDPEWDRCNCPDVGGSIFQVMAEMSEKKDRNRVKPNKQT